MLAEQHRNLEETKKAIREQVEQGMIQGYAETYLDIEAIPYHQLANHMSLPGGGDYAVIAEIDGQQWLPYMQAPQPGATYMTRNEDAKLQQGGGHWNQYSAEARTQQDLHQPFLPRPVPSHMWYLRGFVHFRFSPSKFSKAPSVEQRNPE
ncbi:hypothetical protein ANN_21624 [Periplaneta americana]|uniref:Uncharacterized protein n=1 Tax=Periplaneta americana TaxID=6978 RepID=A0ABQ8S6G8_PERAM|nr:hypothetical protein ANN_21624 [Periplaneta americana]